MRQPKNIGARTRLIRALSSSSETDAIPSQENNERIKQTLADLDALLGVEEEPEEEEVAQEAKGPEMTVSVSPDVLKVIAEAEAKRASNSAGGPESPEVTKKVSDSIGRIVEQARKLSESEEKDSTAGEQAMRQEFEQLLTVLTNPRGIDQEEIKILKEKVFGPQSFWVTEAVPAFGLEEGLIVRGNFRGPREAVFAEVCKKVEEIFGGKYIVRLIEEDVQGIDSEAEPRVVFQILPADIATPPATAGWQRGVGFVLLALTFGSALQLGLAANVGLLPKETIAWLANPTNLNADQFPPGLENFDALPYLKSAAAVGVAALVPQIAHEVGHAVVAGIKGLKTGPSFLIPNGQLGTFGSITQLKSLAKNRSDLFDFAAAGLLSGGAVSLGLFLAGLVASHAGGGADAGLVPVPVQLFEGSLLLGGMCKLALGADAMAKANVFVSPLLVGGWCGLVATALNALPVGNLDGGRTMLAAYGKNALAFSSLASYVGLGLGVLGSSLALPFGLYVLICQRESERNVQDEVTEVDDRRQALALALAAAAVLVLLPGFPDATDAMLMGSPSNFL